MAKSAELKDHIVAQIVADWGDPEEGSDWKCEDWGDDAVDEALYRQLANPKNWKRVYKGKDTIGDTTFVMREFIFNNEDRGYLLSATVTCDENDNFLHVEFERQ